jgi:ABC-type branched-subunit amino acid transport system ATPase component/ABC-type branched-subunit amino acid transport system permease subunit
MTRAEQGNPDARAAWRRRLAIIGIGLAMAVITHPAIVKPEYWTVVVAIAVFSAAIVLTMTVLSGASGIWSLAHASFVAIGAYLTANLGPMGVPMEACLVASAVTGAAVGYALGLSAGRFSTLYFGLLTLAVSMTASEIIQRWSSVTGGDIGIAVPPIGSLVYMGKLSDKHGASVSFFIATLVFLAVDVVIRGARGRRWRAIKSQRMASMSLGLVPHRENALAFALSAGLASMAGVAAAISVGYLDPGDFSLERGVILIVGSVVGGIGSIPGAVFGGFFLSAVPELARGLRDVTAFAFGTSMILVLLFLPKGVIPSVMHLLRRRAKARPAASGTAAPGDATAGRIAALVRALMPRATAALTVDDVTVSFGGLMALQNICMQVRPGQTLGLIGPNGAGKTTLLNVLSGYVKPSSHTALTLGAHDLAASAPHARLAAGFGRTFQHAELFDELTVREQLMLAASSRGWNGRPDAGTPEDVAGTLLRGLDLTDVADAWPRELPFGIQKVVDIGRMLAAGPELVALDEPFSGLDQEESSHLRAILRGMKEAGVSIIIIDHAVQEVLDIADHVVVLDFGKVLAAGSPAQIRSDDRVLAAYFGKADKAALATLAETADAR